MPKRSNPRDAVGGSKRGLPRHHGTSVARGLSADGGCGLRQCRNGPGDYRHAVTSPAHCGDDLMHGIDKFHIDSFAAGTVLDFHHTICQALSHNHDRGHAE